jgi:phosphoribosyl-ATP pyrophosphohydrolase
MTLNELYKIIITRKKELPKDSYVTSLLEKGLDRVIQKVGEEATEVIIAAKNENQERFISEVADLMFHTLILLAARGLSLDDIYAELEKRNTARDISKNK